MNHADSPLSVVLVGNYPTDQQQSMQRYAELLRAELRARGHQAELLRPEPRVGRLKPGATGLGKWLGYVDKFILFPRALRRAAQASAGRTVFHICDHSNAMYAAALRGFPHLTTCHDLLAIRSALGHFPQNPTGWSGRRLQAWILSGLRRSDRIVCVSHETRRQLIAFPGFAEKTVDVVPNGLNHPYVPLPEAESRARFLARPALAPHAGRAFVFFIGGTQWYKNRAGMLRMFLAYAAARPDGVDLLFAGKPFTSADEALLAAAPPALRSRIHHVGAPDNEGLHALYARARCLFFPSLEEGFGWPIVEAMSAGCPVLTSHRAPMNEIGGDAAAYVHPTDETAGAAILTRLLEETPEARAERVRAGLQRAQAFTTSAMIDGFVGQYRQTLAAAT
jgi:glycosyltransferase involved in cell wall biosynthesis